MPPDESKSLQSLPPTELSNGTPPAKEITTTTPTNTQAKSAPSAPHPIDKEVEANPVTPPAAPRLDGVSGKREDSLPPIGSPTREKTASNPHQSADRKAAVQDLQMPSERVAGEVHSPLIPKGFLRRGWKFASDSARDFGALVTGLASIGVTVVIAIFAHQIGQKQAESMVEQSKAAHEEVRLNFIGEFRERLGELTDDDQQNRTKKTVAAIALAQYGEGAMPALKMSLAAGDEDVRDGAAVVVVQMISEKNMRRAVLSKLKDYLGENNGTLRAGVLECYMMLTGDNLPDDEILSAVKSQIREHINPSKDYSVMPQEQRVLLRAAKAFSNWPSRDAAEFLLAVAKNHTCGDAPREHAINYLQAVTAGAKDLSVEQRESLKKEMVATLQSLLPEATQRLKPNLNEAIRKLQEQ